MVARAPNPVNPGVLDFQDAVYGPITYDVASLLRDAFLSWDEEFELDCFIFYWERAKKAGLPVDPRFRRVLPPARMDGSATAHQGARPVLPDQLSRQQTALHAGSAAFHRLCAQGGRTLPRRCVEFARLLDELEGRARTKSATPSDRCDVLEESDDFRRRARRSHASVDGHVPEAFARSRWQTADRLADRTTRASGLSHHRDQSRVAWRADRIHARQRLALAGRVALLGRTRSAGDGWRHRAGAAAAGRRG